MREWEAPVEAATVENPTVVPETEPVAKLEAVPGAVEEPVAVEAGAEVGEEVAEPDVWLDIVSGEEARLQRKEQGLRERERNCTGSATLGSSRSSRASSRSRGGNSRAGQVVERSGGELRTDNTETGAGRGLSSILEDVPVSVDLVEKHATANLVPVGLCVVGRGNGQVLLVTADRPASLGDPESLVVGGSVDLVDGILEKRLSAGDVVGVGVLEVWVRIETEPVNSLNDGVVGGVVPGSPGVNVTDGDMGEACAGDGGSHGLDVIDNVVRVLANTRLGSDTSG